MSAAHLLPSDTVGAPPRKRFTRTEFLRLMESGIFDGQRYELIDGDLIDKMGQNPPHAEALQLLTAWFALIFGIRRVRIQVPIQVASEDQPRSFPEPDIAVLVEKKRDYGVRHPNGDELVLVAEIADTNSLFDLSVKANLYARAAVPEYWVLDIANRQLSIHRHPVAGHYRQVTRLVEQETVSLNSTSVLISELMA